VEFPTSPGKNETKLFLASAVTLYFEVLVIRHLPTEVRVFTNLKHLPLIAASSVWDWVCSWEAPVGAYELFSPLRVGGGWVAVPVLFSGIVFSSSMRRFRRPAEALGVNLYGAVLGGLLENTVMIGGTPVLKALAIGMYALSAVRCIGADSSLP
jgi:hypothetical protein